MIDVTARLTFETFPVLWGFPSGQSPTRPQTDHFSHAICIAETDRLDLLGFFPFRFREFGCTDQCESSGHVEGPRRVFEKVTSHVQYTVRLGKVFVVP